MYHTFLCCHEHAPTEFLVAPPECFGTPRTRFESVPGFTTRARMPEVKGNYKGKHSDLICRWCKNATETQQHILRKCPMFQDITRNTPYDTYFNDEEEATSTVKDIIQKVKTKLSNPP